MALSRNPRNPVAAWQLGIGSSGAYSRMQHQIGNFDPRTVFIFTPRTSAPHPTPPNIETAYSPSSERQIVELPRAAGPGRILNSRSYPALPVTASSIARYATRPFLITQGAGDEA